ncbi:MAG: hypothetical protein UY76_C0064G0001, partial [Candidatus Uhrbacteria bacterium GW2011_GWA2_52_8d]
ESTPRPRHQVLCIKPGRVTLVCGQSFTFDLKHVDPNGVYQIDATAAGGSIIIDGKRLSGVQAKVTMTDPTQIQYQAGQEVGRRYALQVTRLLPDGSEGETASTVIRLEHSSSFGISPQILYLEGGESARVSLVNEEGLNGFTWFFRGETQGHVEPDPDGRGAVVTAPTEEGNYTIVCQSASGTRAEARVVVASDDGEKPDLTKQTTKLVVDEVSFTIIARASGESLEGTPIPLSWSIRGTEGRSYVVMIGFQSALAMTAAREGWLDRLIESEVVHRIAAAVTHEGGISSGLPPSQEDVWTKRDTLMALLFRK